jgi:hypothetical protein
VRRVSEASDCEASNCETSDCEASDCEQLYLKRPIHSQLTLILLMWKIG